MCLVSSVFFFTEPWSPLIRVYHWWNIISLFGFWTAPKQIVPAKAAIQKQPEHGIQNAFPFHLHFPSQWWMSAIQSTIFRLNEVIGSSEKSEQCLTCTAKSALLVDATIISVQFMLLFHKQLNGGINLFIFFFIMGLIFQAEYKWSYL